MSLWNVYEYDRALRPEPGDPFPWPLLGVVRAPDSAAARRRAYGRWFGLRPHEGYRQGRAVVFPSVLLKTIPSKNLAVVAAARRLAELVGGLG